MAKKAKVKIFEDLRESLRDALAYERGEKIDLRAVELPAPPRRMTGRQIRGIRTSLGATQVVFATYLNVSANTVRSWEQGTRKPHGADLKLLAIVRKNPKALLEA